MDDLIVLAEEKMNKAIESMERRFTNVRAGRANPAIWMELWLIIMVVKLL